MENLIEKRLLEVIVKFPPPGFHLKVDLDYTTITEKLITDKYYSTGGSKDEWKVIRISVECHSLTKVVARLTGLVEITSLELNKAPRADVKGLLQILPALRVLEIDYSERSASKLKNVLDVLPPKINSLTIASKFLHKSHYFFTHPRVQGLRQLHVYGLGDISISVFKALKVKRLCLEDITVTLEELNFIVNE